MFKLSAAVKYSRSPQHLLFGFTTLSLIIFCGCHSPKNHTGNAFYYWKSNFNLSAKDTAYLHYVNVRTLYLHLFDVTWNKDYHQALPVDEITFSTLPQKDFSYIPVIYISTEALKNTPDDEIEQLGTHIINQVNHITATNHFMYEEFQVDCDWTELIQLKYFSLLSFLKEYLHKSGKLLSATIRLHQVKYFEKTGVPPIDKGMLMFYNMGKINSVPEYNSIYNDADARKYSSYISGYPMALDVALPIFSWTIQSRAGKVIDLFQKTDDKEYNDSSFFRTGKNNIFVSRSSFFFHSHYFIKGDSLKIEEITPTTLSDAESEALKYLKNKSFRITLFEYDSLYISHFSKEDIKSVFMAAR